MSYMFDINMHSALKQINKNEIKKIYEPNFADVKYIVFIIIRVNDLLLVRPP